MQALKTLTSERQIDTQEDRWEGKAYHNKNSKNNNKHFITPANVGKNISSTGNTTEEKEINYNATNKCKSKGKFQPANANEQNVLLTTSTENKQKSTKQHFSPLKRNIMQLRMQNTLHFLHAVQQNLCLLEHHCKQQNEYYKQEESIQEQQLEKRQPEKTCCKEEKETSISYEQFQNDNSETEIYSQLKENNEVDDSNTNFANDDGTNKFAVVDVVSGDHCSKNTNEETNECSDSATEDLVEHNQSDKCSVDDIMEEEEKKNTTITTREESNTNLLTDMTEILLSPLSLEYLLSISGRQHISKVKELCNKLSKELATHQKYYCVKILQTSLERNYYTLLRKAAILSFESLEEEQELELQEESRKHDSKKIEMQESTPCKAKVERTEQENYRLDRRCTMEHNNIVVEKNASLERITSKTKEDSGNRSTCENAYEHDEYISSSSIKVHKCNINALPSINVAKPSTCDTDNNFTIINSLSENNNNTENKRHREQKRELEEESKLVCGTIDESDKDYNSAKEISSSKTNEFFVNNTHSTTIHPLSHIIDQRNYTLRTISENNINSINSNIVSGKSNKANRYPRTLAQIDVRYILSQCDKLQEIKQNKSNNALEHENKTQLENVEEENSVYAIYKNIGIQPLFTNNMYCSNNYFCQDNTQTTNKDAIEQLHEHKLQKGQLQVMYYCRNVITTTLDNIAFTLLQALYKEQRELKRKKPLQFKAHQRYVVGFNETLKFLRSGRIKCVILAADIEVETEEAMTDASNTNNVDDNITESSKVYSTITDENTACNKEKKNVSSDTCCDNYESTPLSALEHAKTNKEQKKEVVDKFSVSTNTKSAKTSTTRKRFQSLRAALTELAALCADKKKMMCGSNCNMNAESNNTCKEDEENKLIQSRKQRRNTKQHHINNTTDKEDNTITHSVECDTSCVDVQKDDRNNNSKVFRNAIASNVNNNIDAAIPCITCMSRQRLAYALFAKNSSIACVGVIKAEKNHELLKALMLYGRVLHEYYAELMHRYNITT